MPMKRTERNALKYLESNGPTAGVDIPNSPRPSDRQLGVRKFNLQPKRNGAVTSGVGAQTYVYYIEGEHTTQEVVDVWVDANEKALEKGNDSSIHWRTPKEFRDAMSEHLGDLSHNQRGMRRGEHDNSGECPLCGEKYTNSLPNHLPCEGEE